MSVTWTGREWQAVAQALPAGVQRPTPAQIDAAQKVALTIDRQRSIASLYGRLNRARYMSDLALARRRIEQAPLERKARLADLLVQLAEVEAEIAKLRGQQEREQADWTQATTAEATQPEVTIAATVEKLRRVDVVGCVGHQMQRVMAAMPRDLLRIVRFIDTDALRRMRDRADAVVLVSGFINHAAQERYSGCERLFVPKPTALHIVPAVSQLARGAL